jgi:hypothetical protein
MTLGEKIVASILLTFPVLALPRQEMESMETGQKSRPVVVPKVLSHAAQQSKADLLVTGCYRYGGHLRTHGYGIICAVPIPVINV